jgi:hypothetical protein
MSTVDKSLVDLDTTGYKLKSKALYLLYFTEFLLHESSW